VIQDVDKTVEALLKAELPAELTNQVAISFAAPDDQFPPSTVTPPALDLFLYDIRENADLRAAEWRSENHNGTMRTVPPAVRIDFSYLVTAWPGVGVVDVAREEHALLGAAMQALLRHEHVPEGYLQGSLAGQEPPLPASALTSGRLQAISDFWQALGGKPKPALNYTITASVDRTAPVELGPPVTERVLRVGLTDGES
jgi:hypothetical protein